ncbi:unnamed protein product [Vitrella brassicaformis CCMP3155]|uniref:Uncharacterized protein n=2 Tax=Vitrella brassicaformis TaxID=1169539 RepID=A0A0G4FG54_VITBC|nr:unnamed protein product [Vitrella brassicaformis CCMP3155]|eukprot:CEM12184.1 unnamed protein product [Vitrella brassicaformis CCMP3155]
MTSTSALPSHSSPPPDPTASPSLRIGVDPHLSPPTEAHSISYLQASPGAVPVVGMAVLTASHGHRRTMTHTVDLEEDGVVLAHVEVEGESGGQQIGGGTDDGLEKGEGVPCAKATRTGRRDPLNRIVSMLFGSQTQYGSVFLMLNIWTYVSQGFRGPSEQAMVWTAMRQGANPAAVQAAIGTMMLPWVLKPCYGLLADTFPICRRHIKPYYLMSAALAMTCLACVASESITPDWTNMVSALLAMEVGGAFMDVLADALVVREAKYNDSGSGDVQSMSWFCLALGAILSMFVSGVLFDAEMHRVFVAIVAGAQSLAFVLMIAYRERPTPTPFTWNVLKTLSSNLWAVLKTVSKPICWRPMIWFFFAQVASFSLSTPLQWMRKEIGFSEGQIQYASAVNFLFLMLGTVVYGRFLQKVTFRKIWFGTTLILTTLILPDYIQASRLNVSWGIPDWLFLYGADSFATFFDRIYTMPFLVMAAQLCPPGLEALLFAGLMSWSNLATSCQRHLGAAVQSLYGVTEDNYLEMLPSLILIKAGCTLVPLLFLFLVPNTCSILTDAQKELYGVNFDNQSTNKADRQQTEEATTVIEEDEAVPDAVKVPHGISLERSQSTITGVSSVAQADNASSGAQVDRDTSGTTEEDPQEGLTNQDE